MCFSKKDKPGKGEKPPQALNLCAIHNIPLTFICISSIDRNAQIRCCLGCKNARPHDEFITLDELKQTMHMQSAYDLCDGFKHKLIPLFNETEAYKAKFLDIAHRVHDELLSAIEEIFCRIVLVQKQPDYFYTREVYHLLGNSTLEQITGLVDQQLTVEKANDQVLQLLGKLLHRASDATKLLDCLPHDYGTLKHKLERADRELKESYNFIQKYLQQAVQLSTQQITVSKDNALAFIQEAATYDNARHGLMKQKLQDLKQVKKLKQKNDFNEESDIPPSIKSIVTVGNYVAYGNNNKTVFVLDAKNGFESVATFSTDYDITCLGKAEDQGNPQVLVSLEVNEEQYQLESWAVKAQPEKLWVMNAHHKYIWNIINLPSSLIATCGEDNVSGFCMQIKIINLKNRQLERTIAVHQAAVNDIALINEETIVSVSDDNEVMVSNYANGDLLAHNNQEHEVKCVVAMGQNRFVTGNTEGKVIIYHLIDKQVAQQRQAQHSAVEEKELEILRQINLHRGLVRFMKRVSPKIVVTSSWDGTNMVLSIEGEQMKTIEGCKKNFNEPICWVDDSLLCSMKGQLVVYQ